MAAGKGILKRGHIDISCYWNCIGSLLGKKDRSKVDDELGASKPICVAIFRNGAEFRSRLPCIPWLAIGTGLMITDDSAFDRTSEELSFREVEV